MQRHLLCVRLLLSAAGFALLVARAPAATPTHVLRIAPRAQSVRNAKPARKGHPLGPHHLFGTIVGINGDMLSVLRRNGKYVTVDATTAINNDDYSYPLFVGKAVAVDGSFSSNTVFVAVHVLAITTLQSLETDQ